MTQTFQKRNCSTINSEASLHFSFPDLIHSSIEYITRYSCHVMVWKNPFLMNSTQVFLHDWAKTFIRKEKVRTGEKWQVKNVPKQQPHKICVCVSVCYAQLQNDKVLKNKLKCQTSKVQNHWQQMLTLNRVTDFILEAWSSNASFMVNLLTIVWTSLSHFQIALAHVGECLATAMSTDNMHSSRATVGSVCKQNQTKLTFTAEDKSKRQWHRWSTLVLQQYKIDIDRE